MIFLAIIGVVAYFTLLLLFSLWLCYSVFDMDIEPEPIVCVTLILEIALFVQILAWMGVFD